MSAVIAVVVLTIMLFAGKAFISITFNQDLAQAEGIRVSSYELLFLMLMAGVIALAIKLVGITLITALLVIPAATAQNISRSLQSLFGISILISIATIVVGMVVSVAFELPSGPTIALSGAFFFIASVVVRHLRGPLA